MSGNVEEYLIDLNATKAAIRAGYSAKTAAEIGHQNLRKLQVAAAIEKAQNKRTERAELTGEMVVDELRNIAFAAMADYVPVAVSSWGASARVSVSPRSRISRSSSSEYFFVSLFLSGKIRL